MSTTLANLQERLAFRLAEDGAPNDSNESNRRKSFINEGYRKVMGEHFWWFLPTTSAQSSVNGQEIYDLPSDFRDIIEVRYNRKIAVSLPTEDAFGSYNYPPLYYQYRSAMQKYFIFGDNELHLLPVPTETPTTHTVSGITRSGTTATATTSTAHDLLTGDYVIISGADQTDYNGTFRVKSVPTTTTFTYTVENTPTTPATGTITAVWANISYRYYRQITPLSSESDTIMIPDRFADILVAYAYGRYGYIDDIRANSNDGFKEYNNILNDMIQEHNFKNNYEKATPPLHSDYTQE